MTPALSPKACLAADRLPGKGLSPRWHTFVLKLALALFFLPVWPLVAWAASFLAGPPALPEAPRQGNGAGYLGNTATGVIIAVSDLWAGGLLRLTGATGANLALAHDYGSIIYAMMLPALVQNTLTACEAKRPHGLSPPGASFFSRLSSKGASRLGFHRYPLP